MGNVDENNFEIADESPIENTYKSDSPNLDELFADDEEISNLKKNNKDFVDISGGEAVNTTDFEIIQEKKNVGGIIGNIFKWIIFIVGVLALVFIAAFCSMYKVIPENIHGAQKQIKGNSIISRNYNLPESSEWRKGDTLIIVETPDFMPYVFKYEKYTFKSFRGVYVFAEDLAGNEKKLQVNEISYIIKSSKTNVDHSGTETGGIAVPEDEEIKTESNE